MMTPTERATLAASDHYAARLRAMTDALRVAPWHCAPALRDALAMIERARSAELRDPHPYPDPDQ